MFFHIDKHLGELIIQIWHLELSYFVRYNILPRQDLSLLLFFQAIRFYCRRHFCSNRIFNITLLIIVLALADIAGDTVNYWIGNYIGPKIFKKDKIRFLKKEHLQRTHEFYERHGGKTIIIARFIPIIRTFAPFVAGIGSMTYLRFISYNILRILWVCLFCFTGLFVIFLL